MGETTRPGLERSCGRQACGPTSGDWLSLAPASPGIERFEAFFAGYAYDPHRHDTYAVGVTLGGVQCFDYRGEMVVSTPGKLIVVHPDERHNGRSGGAAGFRYRMAYIEPRLIRDALGGGTRPLPFVRRALSTDPRLRRAIELTLGDLSRAPEELEADQIVLSLAEAMAALDPSLPGRRVAPASAIAVDRARDFIEAAFERPVASAELEAVTGLDRYALARHFRTLLGTSPYRYLTMRRLGRARALIRGGEALAEAACAAGFADQSHMTRQFKEAYGVSPGRWRAVLAGVS